VGVRSGDGKIALTYDAPPQSPANFGFTVDNEVNVTLSWDDVADETEYELYRSTTSGVDSSDTLVTTLGANTTTYTDSFSDDIDHYYKVRGVNNGVAGYFSDEIHVQVGSINYYDGNSWTTRTVYHGQALDVAKQINTY